MKKKSILNISDNFNVYLSQPKLIGENGKISKMIEKNYLPSMIFYGPSGSGKTQLIKHISKLIKQEILYFHASFSTKKEFETTIVKNSIIFIDEFHNLDKKKQDYMLYLIDNLDVILIGATTQNPYYSVSNALFSRMLVVDFQKPNQEIMLNILNFHIQHSSEWLIFKCNIIINLEQKIFLIENCGYDIRKMLLSLEIIVNSNQSSELEITNNIIKKQLLHNSRNFENKTSNNYNLCSALQKSIRGSHVDASLYYLAKLILNSELTLILRRLRVIVYEDIGFANLDLITRVINSLDVCEKIGLPEAKIPLSLIVSEMALSPKDNSAYLGIKNALEIANKYPNLSINENICYKSKTYKYPFDYEHNLSLQEYLPKEIENIEVLKIKSNSKKAKFYEMRRINLKKYFKKV